MAKWIKVTDKLPKIGELVLSTDMQDVYLDEVFSITMMANETCATWKNTDTHTRITHWQPLPALPEVEK